LYGPPLTACFQKRLELLEERLLGGGRIARIAPALQDTAIRKGIEQAFAPGVPAQVRTHSRLDELRLAVACADTAQRQRVLVEIDDEAVAEPWLLGVGGERQGERRRQ